MHTWLISLKVLKKHLHNHRGSGAIIYRFSTKKRQQRNMSIKQRHQNLCLIKADNETKPVRQECVCLKNENGKTFMKCCTDGAIFLWAPVHEGIQRKHFHIIITCQLVGKWQHISFINVAFPSYCTFCDS